MSSSCNWKTDGLSVEVLRLWENILLEKSPNSLLLTLISMSQNLHGTVDLKESDDPVIVSVVDLEKFLRTRNILPGQIPLRVRLDII